MASVPFSFTFLSSLATKSNQTSTHHNAASSSTPSRLGRTWSIIKRETLEFKNEANATIKGEGLSACLKKFVCVAAINVIQSGLIVKIFNDKNPLFNFKLSSFVPSTVQNGIANYLIRPADFFSRFAENLLPVFHGETKYGLIFYHALAEEVIYRAVIQQGLLRKAPQCVLQKVAPKYSHLVDCQVAKIARIVLASGIFAIAHLSMLDQSCSVLPQFGSGIIYGIIKEYTGSITIPVLSHAMKNYIVCFYFPNVFPD